MTRFALRVGLVLLLLGAASVAWSQDEPGEDDGWLEEPAQAESSASEGASEAGNAETTQPAASAVDPRADALYQAGLDAIDVGDYAEAKRQFEAFLQYYPDDPRVEGVKRLMAASKDANLGNKGKPSVARKEEKATGSSAAAVELTSVATSWGIFTGIVIGYQSESFSTGLISASLGGIIGMLSAVLYSWTTPVSQAEASLLSTGIFGGIWHVLALSAVTDGFGDNTLLTAWGVGTAGGIAGLLVGALTDIDDGHVALANSAALWGTFLMGMFAIMGSDDMEGEDALGLLLLGTDLGFVGGAVAGYFAEVSRERMAIIDLGGVLGGLMGLGIMIAVDPSEDDGRTSVPLALIATAGAGLALTAFATRNMDRDTITLSEGVPIPSPFLLPQVDERGRSGFAVGVQLMGSSFF
ncbi:MAG: hypothetical protein RBU37_25795 [Myxococcota bacterium]|nr:hypothetical protein [Myxococcota bacterium]